MKRSERNPHLQAAILEVVENQLSNNDPPQTEQTFKRLIQAGHSEKEAKRLIGCVVSAEIFDVLKKNEPFNLDRFVKGLNKLPTMPWEGEKIEFGGMSKKFHGKGRALATKDEG